MTKKSLLKNDEHLPDYIEPKDYLIDLWERLTPSVCDEVFELTRDKERQRKWGLHTILKTWIGLLQTKLTSQTRMVEEFCRRGHPLFPQVEASPESFFKRIQNLRPAFFKNIFTHYTNDIRYDFPENFISDIEISEEVFPQIYAVDASRLASVGRVLKVAKKTTKAIIPGSIEAVYDLRRGHIHDLWFDPDGARSEMAMFDKVVDSIEPCSLLVSDRYYSKPIIWKNLENRGIAMVSRYNGTVGKIKKKVLKKIRTSKISVDDWLVEMGGSQHGEEPILLRWISVRTGESQVTLITNVLDPKILSVEQAVALYRRRWSIERMYLHLKEVLSLNTLFNASPSAVGQQVFATAILYNALRLSQSKIAHTVGIIPERISPEKLFPRVMEKILQLAIVEMAYENANEHQIDYKKKLQSQTSFQRGISFCFSKEFLWKNETEREEKEDFARGEKVGQHIEKYLEEES